MNSREVDLGFWEIIEHGIGRPLTSDEETSRTRQVSYHAARDPRLISAAGMYGLVQSQQLPISPKSHEQAMNDLADMAEEYRLDCDQIHALLQAHEPGKFTLIRQPVIWPSQPGTESAAE